MKDLTTSQTGAILGISPGMVCRLYRQGKLDGYKIHNRCLIIKKNDKYKEMLIRYKTGYRGDAI